MKHTLFVVLALFFATSIFAQESAEHHDGPCIKIMEACKTAGYNKSSATEKKSLSKNCLQPLLSGHKVEGVIINQSDLESCKTKKAEIKSQK